MSRELKFRAYIKHLEIMVNVIEIDFYLKTITAWILSSYEGDPSIFPFDEVVLMQFTGLKDKKGVDIYEGDTLQWHEDISDFHDRTICGTAEFVRGRYTLSPRGYYGSLGKVCLDAVIIGNVF